MDKILSNKNLMDAAKCNDISCEQCAFQNRAHNCISDCVSDIANTALHYQAQAAAYQECLAELYGYVTGKTPNNADAISKADYLLRSNNPANDLLLELNMHRLGKVIDSNA